jgi:SET domain-containing protein
MSLVAKRDIEPGEEIYTSYNYDVQKAPVWYQVGNRCM